MGATSEPLVNIPFASAVRATIQDFTEKAKSNGSSQKYINLIA